MPGYAVTKGELNAKCGDIAREAQRLFKDVATLQTYMAATADQDLIDMGFTSGEVAVMKSAFTDLTQLGAIWTGSQALASPKDFRTFVSQLWGIGSY